MGLKSIKKLGVAIKKMNTLKQAILMPIVLFLIIWLSCIGKLVCLNTRQISQKD